MSLLRRGTVLYLVWLTGVSVTGAWGLFVLVRSHEAWSFLKRPHLGFNGAVHRADPWLGFAAVPGAKGLHTFPIGPPFPMRYDDQGFRIPAYESPARPLLRPLVLALGCSYTYGDGCPAEKTYPWLVAERLHATSLNAGKCAYGLAQMLLLARELIPRRRPEYVLVQHSPWLVGRGLSGFARATFGKVPAPYFTRGPHGELRVAPPVFRTLLFDLPLARFDNPRGGLRDFASFVWNAGGPLFLHDDANMALFTARRLLGRVPAPAPEQDDVVLDAYREIRELCVASGSLMVVVRLNHPLDSSPPSLGGLKDEGGVVVVRAQEALNRLVPEGTKEAYQRRFAHWRGDPPELVDTHPNPAAHAIIAEEVVKAIAAQSRGG
ncbi:MAG TPA: hypothetical protein VFM88_20240 [Vicinamibacteria bacterium]|nr:hypothetical protein [Vicinamibacteria bacterium]